MFLSYFFHSFTFLVKVIALLRVKRTDWPRPTNRIRHNKICSSKTKITNNKIKKKKKKKKKKRVAKSADFCSLNHMTWLPFWTNVFCNKSHPVLLSRVPLLLSTYNPPLSYFRVNPCKIIFKPYPTHKIIKHNTVQFY